MGVVAYGVHDCAVVKQSDRDAAVKTYRETVRTYVPNIKSNINTHILT